MTDTKELLKRITALRLRLHSETDAECGVEEKARRGAEHNALIDTALRTADPAIPPANAPAVRLTARGVRLLQRGRELLLALRKIADDGEFQQTDKDDTLAVWHREALAMIELVLRAAQAMPASVSMQLRVCEGLEVLIAEIDRRIQRLCVHLAERKKTAARVDELAAYLRALATRQPVSLTPLQALADLILAEAGSNQPLRFLYASPADPSRFAAAHSLTVAQVLARLIAQDADWQPQAQLAMMAALVHDVGMTRVPADVLLTEGPLDADARRLIEKHVAAAEEMLIPVWPGGGWPIEAALCHHERNDGTGYPLGRQEINLAPFVQLLAVCDVYAALCAPRPHRAAFDTRAALTEVLILAERGLLQQGSAERLLRLSFYPVGSAVELSDGRIALVARTHAGEAGLTQPDRPIVNVIADAHRRPAVWPAVLDLREHTELSIVRPLTIEQRRTLAV